VPTPGHGLGIKQAATLGQNCLQPGLKAKCTYGTGAFLVINTGSSNRAQSDGGLCCSTYGCCWRRTAPPLLPGGKRCLNGRHPTSSGC